MFKDSQEQSTIPSYFMNFPPLNCNSYFSPVYYVPKQFTEQLEFKKNYDQLKIKYENLLIENQLLKDKINQLDITKKTKRIIKRRREQDIQREIHCPYPNCSKQYASQVALNLHIKEKHNGGTKKQRQRYAKKVLQALKKHQPIPKEEITLPPGYLQEFKNSLLDHLDSDSSMLYSEQSS